MKTLRTLLYSLLVILLATSCVEERIPSGAQIADIPCVLNADKAALSFSAQGATAELVIKSQNVSWELTGAPEWLSLSQASGTGAATVTVTVTGNKDVDNARVAVLQLKSTTAKYEFGKNITVSQEAAAKYINVDRTSLSFTPQSAQATVAVSSNIDWEAVCTAGWLTLSKTDAATLSVAAGENTTAGSRTATITLRRVGTTQALATINVVQSEAGVTGSTAPVTFDVDGGTKSVDIEADVAWSATTSETSWLTVTPDSGDGGKAQLTIQALANQSATARSGFVYVKIGTEQKLAIPVSQEGVSLNVNGSLKNFAADGGAKQTLTVNSNIAWALLSCPEWLTATPVQGKKGSTEISLQASENKSLNSRSATLSIGVEGLTSAKKDITVTQEGVATDLGDSSLQFGWEESQKEVKITVPDSWSAMVSDSWFSLSQYSGSGGETIVVEAKANDGEDGRTGTITIASEGHSLKITVIQQGQYLKINSTAGEVGAMGGSVSLTVTTSVGETAVVEYEGDAKDWVTFGSDDDGVYTLQVAYNPSASSRTAQFVIKPTMSTTNAACTSGVKFAVTQRGRVLNANVSKIEVSVIGGTSSTYTITADSTYTITKPESDNWYILQHDAANGTFCIVVSENTTGEERTSQITASLTGLPSGETKNLIITVEQADVMLYEAVDLGLPSGLKWASYNLGATKPEEYGGYYAWGETEEKENYDWSTYKWCNGSENSLTKYCTNSSYGTVDNKTILDPEDDVVHIQCGDRWRIPGQADIQELIDNCTWVRTTLNGVTGCRVTSKINGNSIFFPAAGHRGGTEIYNDNYFGYYWSCSLYTVNSLNQYANSLFFNSSGEIDNYLRATGYTVRPVYDEVLYNISVGIAGYGSAEIKGYSVTNTKLNYGTSVTVVATPDEGANFLGWFVSGSDTPVSTAAEYTFTVSQDVALVARFEKDAYLPSGSIGGHYYVDLGLPSGVKWATCNVGATKPEEYGGLYAWGELKTKYYYEKSNCTTYSKHISDISGNPTYDVARADWGDSWRMPTKTECDELVSNCTWEKDTLNGIDGYKVTSNINGNSIFLPAAGWRADAKSYEEGEKVNIWSSTPYTTTYVASAYHIAVDPVCTGFSASYYGMSVRPVISESKIINGHEYVDLGLPSGLKWATCNVGATKPEEYGGYYAWGETEEKDDYSWSTYKWCNGSENSLTKYCTDSSYGTVDNKTVLDPEDDVAHVKWGGTWRMPTRAEQDELRENCTWQWITQDGVSGYKVTGPNGNSIFLPAAGCRLGVGGYNRGSFGDFWSGSLASNSSNSACGLYFDSGDRDWDRSTRCNGRSVRPVSK